MAAEGTKVSPEISAYSATVLSSRADLDQLGAHSRHLWAGLEPSLRLDFFLATLTSSRWKPWIAVVKFAGAIVGLVYTKERRFARLNTGLIYADSTIGMMVVCDITVQSAVFATALRAMLECAGCRGVRLLVPPGGYELPILRTLQADFSLDYYDMPSVNHSVLLMPESYERFLANVGPKTRRNLRYFRNRSLAAGHRFVDQVPLDTFEAAAADLMKEAVIGADADGIARGMSIFRAAERPLLVGIRAQSGEWLSILGGWYEAKRVFVFLQMNSDRRHARFSLSLVMRGYVIEKLIRQGYRDLLWWAGVGPPIGNYVKQVPSQWVYLDKRHFAWRIFRRLLGRHRGRIPAAVLPAAEWIIPPFPEDTSASKVSSGSSDD